MPTPRVVVVDHHDSYVWNLVHLVAAVTGVLPDVVQHDATTPAHVLSYDRVVLSPGPGHPLDASDFAVGGEVVRSATVPVLGVCLGMQGLVSAFGGVVERVRPAHGAVASVHHDGAGVFAGIPSPYPAVRYHSLSATKVPDDLVVTATCSDDDQGTVVMGVRHRSRPLHGVQFHPESVLSQYGARLVQNFLRCAP
ncbi:anthranilate synthase component II [Nocardioides bizhenqiangii]|uniref:Aminodeoxychorismate/anthranilate synthase component II n=1 Tax=Nocardioides bizhenqiangii TaxID=3095076 RepID=A0ABZ0ZTL0_9ACTN|nr:MULTISPECIES: aminodeoxychorismate/anthranilate synthase component II [unclassified Nocardioides]MDZ5621704.1 aminodeoxychorismate/anthranilate synthase component II [Nocardioides sp. HM23]WQQ27610.1 aminodeoxychorismate/anthranilate synthase component II [Nocardioides sp. HM61]